MALDRTATTSRNAVYIINATVKSTNSDLQKVSHRSIHRKREQIRSTEAVHEKNRFLQMANKCLTVHWDGKLLPDITGEEKVDRLPIIVTGINVEEMLAVPKLSSGSGAEQANAVFKALTDWKLDKTVQALSFDTTASNTGNTILI